MLYVYVQPCQPLYNIKNISGNSSHIANYRPIALVTAYSKVFEYSILKMLEQYFVYS